MQVRRRARCGCGRSGHVVGPGWLVGLLLFPFTFIDSGHYMYVLTLACRPCVKNCLTDGRRLLMPN